LFGNNWYLDRNKDIFRSIDINFKPDVFVVNPKGITYSINDFGELVETHYENYPEDTVKNRSEGKVIYTVFPTIFFVDDRRIYYIRELKKLFTMNNILSKIFSPETYNLNMSIDIGRYIDVVKFYIRDYLVGECIINSKDYGTLNLKFENFIREFKSIPKNTSRQV